ncbi:MAG: thiamine pyrophosphate-dependent enzyme [Methanomicrobiales archaeon]|nr:thiamine pyrophosphate-dependent enzyme [Methanomicrobiales archaeon]
MTDNNFTSRADNTWCPGCGNFAILQALKEVFAELEHKGIPREEIVLVAGIGQHGKLFDLLTINGFYSLHGRTIPVATGIRLANPDLRVICVAGDGDCYAEGLDHLIFGAKRNLDITVLVHDNRVYGLTTGQYTPTSPSGFRGRSTPGGIQERPLNPLELMLASGASFIGRGYSRHRDQLKRLIEEAILHRGFAFLDILQICPTYSDLTEYYNKHIYDWDTATEDFQKAWEKAREWNYSAEGRIGLGVMYKTSAPVFEDAYPGKGSVSREVRRAFTERLLAERI